MAPEAGSIEHRLITMRGQLQGLLDLHGNGDAARSQCARLIRLIDGQWAGIRNRYIVESLDELLESVPEDERDGLGDVVEALEKLTRV